MASRACHHESYESYLCLDLRRNPETDSPNPWGSIEPSNTRARLTDCTVSQVPQMITITFDDAVNNENWELYQRLFMKDRKNPNGCNIRATFYISHEFTNYAYVQRLWNEGHEIAVHSITHRGPESYWSHNATIEDWFDEFVGQANIINRFAGVRMEDLWEFCVIGEFVDFTGDSDIKIVVVDDEEERA
ncbi:NodB domain [Trinorchestia longiramus]|nr:NodB domain [Trinorchestia longiramus]